MKFPSHKSLEVYLERQLNDGAPTDKGPLNETGREGMESRPTGKVSQINT